MTDLADFLQKFLSEGGAFRKGAALQMQRERLAAVFGQFVAHLAACRDPEFFGQVVKVDSAHLKKALITLRVFDDSEIRICFDVVLREGNDWRGVARCFWVAAYEIAQLNIHAERQLIGKWEFDDSGETNIVVQGHRLYMNHEKEAVALATGLLFAASGRA